ncbi:MAG: nucleotidyltransferase domain-containing protein [Verrucomicrobiales bacterium]|jgi:predicted nucleotidyltransferase|nr:nucleotidyltransferase domain-containing protein [Verrucomicrobiales bacterium]
MKIIDGIDYVSLAEAKRVARRVADCLRRRYGATKVLVFGSVVDGFYVPGHSDIDIYFEGVPREDEMSVTGRLMLDFADYDIDFRPAGLCHPRFKASVLAEGLAI